MSAPAEKPLPHLAPATTAAAKLHVLNLAPIKAKLDGKWPKLSELVHQLFEKSIRDAQGPRDHFVQLDELSYVCTFHGLAFEEASLACAAIAQEVCEKLFGGVESGIAVRALVGELSDQILSRQFGDGAQIDVLLELHGQEILVTNNPAAPPPTVTEIVPGRQEVEWEPLNTITKARTALAPLGLQVGMFPIWDLARKTSSCLYASAYPAGRPGLSSTRRLLGRAAELVPEAEIHLLYTAHAYAHRVRNAHRVCAVGAAVSFETLTHFNWRVRYITALKSLSLSAECPVLLKLEEIPAGTPLGKLAELIGMLSVPDLRFVLQFASHMALPDDINFRIGAAGIGCALPSGCEPGQAAAIMKKLVHAFATQKGFTFVEGLNTTALVDAAKSSGVRFGTGSELGSSWHSAVEPVPHFPLSA